MTDSRVGKRIRENRDRANISQEALAEQVGLSVTAMSNIERGMNYPSMEHFIKIANVIGSSADALLCDVVNGSCDIREFQLSAQLANVSAEKRRQIYAVIEALLHTDN